ncbi:MAG: universal stress protein [Actinomycetota bacterium]
MSDSGAQPKPAVPRLTPKRIEQILVATDFSAGAHSAIERAIRLAARLGARLSVVHVLPIGASAEAVGIAKSLLNRYAYELRAQVLTSVATGSAGVEISAEAQRRNVDLIVVGAHGGHWLRDVFVGSTVETVLEVSAVPVLIVKDAAVPPYARVLLAVDNSLRSFRAAQAGIDMTPGAHHIVAHAVTVPGEGLLRLSGAVDSDVQGFRSVQLAEAQPAIKRLAGELVPPADEVLVESGRPEVRIREFAEDHLVNLVVAGTERGTGIRHTLLGSVSRSTMQRVSCDVLIVPLS